MDEMMNDIDLSKYFINHYDNFGKLYAIEHNGNPLELQNAIKNLQEENKELKEKIKSANCCPYYDNGDCSCMGEVKEVYKYKQALEEIRDILCQGRTFYNGYFDREPLSRIDTVIKKINEVLK